MTETQAKPQSKKRKKGRLYVAFVVVALLGGCLPILFSNKFAHEFSMKGASFSLPFLQVGGSNAKENGSQKDSTKKESEGPKTSRVAGLNCKPWGGPSNKAAAEMVYWEDIPQDSKHLSPFYIPDTPPQYFSFEMDFAGWNNVR